MRSIPALLVALVLSAVTAAAQEGELDRLVREESARVEQMDVESIWGRALELRLAEDLGGEGDLDRALDRLLQAEGSTPRARLFGAAARIQGQDADAALLAHALVPLLEQDEALARAAAGLLANDIFRALLRDERESLGRALVAAARDGDRSPEARMAFAAAAARVGRGTEMRQARDEMRAFLDSADPATRALGALALAATGVEITDDLERELERLAVLPDQRGSLASAYLKQEQIRALHERKYKDLRDEVDQRGGLTEDQARMDAVMRMVSRYHLEGQGVTEEELTEAALQGMLRFMDDHSSYFGPESYARFLQELEAEYGGIGAYVGIDELGDRLFTITRPIYSGPAYRAGLQTDDKIVRVGDWPTVGEPVDDVIKRLKGKPGSDVKLYVWRRGMDPDLIDRPTEDMAVVLQREEIHIPAVSHQMLPGGIGLVDLSTFSRGCGDELREVFGAMQEQGMRALILDLRRNSGGLLEEAVNVADLFLGPGQKVVTTQGTLGRPDTRYTSQPPALPEDLPVVVLTSRFTASASEIVAGALRDWDRATLLGETSFGKGSVQRLLPVLDIPEDQWEDENGNERWDDWEEIVVDHDGDGVVDYRPRVKMTVERYLLPSGLSIHRELDEAGNVLSEGGIEPDVLVRYPLIDSWRYAERRRLQQSSALIKGYVAERWEGNFELFRKLATTDLKDESLYPDFDRLMTELQTTLPREDVRLLVRNEVRRRVQDSRGAEFPIGDFQEDYQVQRAIDHLLATFDESPAAYDPFARTFLDPTEVQDDHLALVGPEPRPSDRVRDAQALIREIREQGGAVTPDQLDRVLEALGYGGEDDE
jgi:C-terminal peptidase prc